MSLTQITGEKNMKENKALVTVMGKEIEQIEYKGFPVITYRMMDDLHQRPEGTTKRNFNQHKDKLIDREDYFEVPYSEWSRITAVRNSYDQDSENGHGGYTKASSLLLPRPAASCL